MIIHRCTKWLPLSSALDVMKPTGTRTLQRDGVGQAHGPTLNSWLIPRAGTRHLGSAMTLQGDGHHDVGDDVGDGHDVAK